MTTCLRSLLAVAASISLLATTPTQAQTIPNGSFDNWATRTSAVSSGVEAPTNWLTYDDHFVYFRNGQQPISNTSGTTTKTTTARTGPFAAQLQTVRIGSFTFPGFLLLGSSLKHGSADLPGGLPFTTRSRNLQFYYQLSGPGAVADSAAVLVLLTRRVGGNAVVVAEGFSYIRTLASTYTLATVPLNYYSPTLSPDSVAIGFATGFARNITPGTTLRIDDVSFTGTVTATRNTEVAAAISVSPNPSPDGRYVLSTSQAGLLAAPLTVLDATGRVVRRETAPGGAALNRPLDLSNLPIGLYTLQLFTDQGVVTRKLTR
ncbi:T9SS type A sorting domain-containing protein [Hymenobacter terrenus]|uniref:T9SS type A sorting domain-containing protein n=1 Tax=Hymenobacter terrenus TaxID=1629124 RepID=UPI0009E4764D|nr:T9SS type A sorting domain-containing protein [Hymenobacter terrenus]